MRNLRFFVSFFFLLLGIAPLFSAEPITIETLLNEMLDRDQICQWPSPSYRLWQASSYDRGAVSKEENWFANNDNSNYERVEVNQGRTEWVMMDAKGPGAVVRWWIGEDYPLNLHFYFDGASEPSYTVKIGDLLGRDAWAKEPLSQVTGRGRNLYLPIPFEKGLKITVSCEDGSTKKQSKRWYVINYRLYEPGTKVESMTPDVLARAKTAIDRASELLAQPYEANPSEITDQVTFETTMGQGVCPNSVKLAGEKMITQIRLNLSAEDAVQALRSFLLSISFDGVETVRVPVGELAGTGVGFHPYQTWYTKVTEDGTLFIQWRMPFKKNAEVRFINTSDQEIKFTAQVQSKKYRWKENTLYFHAWWRQEREMDIQEPRDWTYTDLSGKGVYVGDVLSLVNSVEGWWGEGDEKIYVDHETFPSHFGTGTEDYYGYSYDTPTFFESPWRAQPFTAEGPYHFGNSTNLRFRTLDALTFQDHLTLDMEIIHWNKAILTYAVATFWYGGLDMIHLDPKTGEAATIEELDREASMPVSEKTPEGWPNSK